MKVNANLFDWTGRHRLSIILWCCETIQLFRTCWRADAKPKTLPHVVIGINHHIGCLTQTSTLSILQSHAVEILRITGCFEHWPANPESGGAEGPEDRLAEGGLDWTASYLSRVCRICITVTPLRQNKLRLAFAWWQQFGKHLTGTVSCGIFLIILM
jgi:hypothetical protein